MSSWTETLADMTQRLESFLRAQMPAAQAVRVLKLDRISGGASREAWAFDLQWIEDGRRFEKACIMLRTPDASLLETDRVPEFHVMKALQGTGVPVPPMLWLEGEGSWLDRPFFIMEKVPGIASRNVLLEPEMADVRQRIALQFVEIAARLHTVDWRKLGIDFLKVPTRESAAAEQIAHWEAILEKQQMEPHPVLTDAFLWLKRHQPVAERITIVHGDYRYGNFLFDGDRITAMLDWEMVHLGDPMEDIAWAYRRGWSAEPFIPLEEYLNVYTEMSGIPINRESLQFYRLFGEVKMSIIALTGARSFVDGRTRNLRMAMIGSGMSANMLQFLDWLAELEPEMTP